MMFRRAELLMVVGLSTACPPAPLDPILTTSDSSGQATAEPPTDTGDEAPTGGGPTAPDTTGEADTAGTTGAPDTTGDADAGSSTGGAPVGDCSVVEFADPLIEASIRQWLDLPEGPISGEALAGVTLVSADEASSLAGLECATGLEELYVFGGPLADLSPLAGLPALKLLTLWDVSVTDLSPLAGLPAFTKYAQEGGLVPDLAPLAAIDTLTEVNVTYVELADISPLAGAAGLVEVSVDGTLVGDLSPLAGLQALARVSANSTPVADLTPLAMVPQLSVLRVNDTAVTDLAPLSGKPMQLLTAQNCGVVDVAPIASFTKSPFLIDLSGNSIVDLAPLLVTDWSEPEQCGDVYLGGNPLSMASLDDVFPQLCDGLGVGVHFLPDSMCLSNSCVMP